MALNSNEILVYSQLKADGYTKEAIAAVMGVVGGESGFNYLVEFSYLTTDNSALRNIFAAFVGQSDSFINQCKTSDYNFFNCVYGGGAGNSPTEGYKYRGRGFNGITFKDNYTYVKNGILQQYGTDIDLLGQPEKLEQPEIAAKALSYWFRMVKGYNNLESAFQEAYRQNAGPGYSFAVYQASTNLVHVGGIPRKRGYAQNYYNLINQGAFGDGVAINNNQGSGMVNETIFLPLILIIAFGGYYFYKKYRK
jgi:predicted chitinase